MKLWKTIDLLFNTEEKRRRFCGMVAALVLLWIFTEILSLMVCLIQIQNQEELFAFYSRLNGLRDITLVKLIMSFITFTGDKFTLFMRILKDIPSIWWAGGVCGILFICAEHRKKKSAIIASLMLLWLFFMVFSLIKGVSASNLGEAIGVLHGMAWVSFGIIGPLSGILVVWTGKNALKMIENS